MAYFQTPFTWNDLADAALKPPLRIVNARILNKLDKLQGYRVERPQAALDLAAEMQKRGVLRLALHAGNATLLCADFGQQDSAWMREFRVWHTCRVSRKHHAACPVLFTAQEIPKVIGGKRGPCLGWTQRTLKTNRDRCNALAELGIIAGAVTIAPLPSKCPPRLHRFQKAIQRLLANLGIAHHGCWEGPEPHMHILLCSPMDASTERELRNACFGLYRNHFGYSPVPSPSLVEIDLQLERGQQAAARYVGKTRKTNMNGGNYEQKAKFPWLSWRPYFSHGLPLERVREVAATLPKTPPELCQNARMRKKRGASNR